MKKHIVLAGVGGQGVLAIAQVITRASRDMGLEVLQSEVHGMAQRGGAVVAHVCIADHPLHGSLTPRGGASLLIAMEPMEALRQLEYLSADGVLVTATEPVHNVPDYPEGAAVLQRIGRIPGAVQVPGKRLAREAGNALAINMVLVGVASLHLDIPVQVFEDAITSLFKDKGDKAVHSNIAAFHAGRSVQVVHA